LEEDAAGHDGSAARVLASLALQSYGAWTLTLPDGSLPRSLPASLRDDPRALGSWPIRELDGDAPGFVLSVGAGSSLVPHALARLAQAIGEHPGCDVVYCDEDVAEGSGNGSVALKPGFSQDLLWAHPFTGDLLAVRFSLMEPDEEPPSDPVSLYDLALRATQRGRSVVHLAEVLVHTARPSQPLPYEAGRAALERTLGQLGVRARVEPGPFEGSFSLARRSSTPPKVGIVIPFRDAAAMLANCLGSISTGSGRYETEIVLVDNGSVEPETTALLDRLAQDPGIVIVEHAAAFNWSALNNLGASTCDSDLLLFLNNDTQLRHRDSIEVLAQQALRPEVGVVGARLLYPDGSIQHAGIVLGMRGIAWHIFMGMPEGQTGYLGLDRLPRQMSAVTGACMMTGREAFESLSGFDETLEVAFNDVDYCMRATQAGYRVLYEPRAELTHFEAISRGMAGYMDDARRFLARWDRSFLREDPFYNPNLSREVPWCALRQPGEDERWEAVIDALSGAPAAGLG
ncbi:MAG: glycosyltransferase family 2 protein, partial [Acidimicrobiales bacterium]